MFSQLLINALIAASIYMLVASGIGLIYSVTRFFHFAQGVIFTFGAYIMYVLNQWVGLPLVISAVLAVPLGGLLGMGLEFFIYRPLRIKSATPLVLLLASLGVYVVLQNVISLVFGDASRSVRPALVQEGMSVIGARITHVQSLSILVAFFLLAILFIALSRTRWGRMVRAVVSDAELANISGVDVGSVIFGVSIVASMLVVTGGILQALYVDITPTMGMNALMMGIVVVVIGGIGNIPGAVLGAILLGVAQQLGIWRISSQWQDTIAFIILLVFLLIRPEGIMGRKVRKALL